MAPAVPRLPRSPVARAMLLFLVPGLLAATRPVRGAGDILLITYTPTGRAPNSNSFGPQINPDGTKVVFWSGATNLDPKDRDTWGDIYVRDVATGQLTLMSTADDGTKGNSASYNPNMTPDGTKVVFDSWATNFDPTDHDIVFDVYLKDLSTGDLTLLSVTAEGRKGNGDSVAPRISSDGTKVYFQTFSTNFDPRDRDPENLDVYVKDLVTGELTLVSTSEAGEKGNSSSYSPQLAGDGTTFAFSSYASNLDEDDPDHLSDIFVKDLITGTVSLASTDDAGMKGAGQSFSPSLSADGAKVAFYSDSRLDPMDGDLRSDVFLKDLSTGDVTLVSMNAEGEKANDESTIPDMSPDATRVAFISSATNLSDSDRSWTIDVFVKDLVSGEVFLVSARDVGRGGNDDSLWPAISDDGRRVAFESDATNLHPSDRNAFTDIYLKILG